MSFVKYEAEIRTKNSQLRKLHEIIDWVKLEKILGKLGRSGFGPQGYEPIKLLKALVLQNWHSLSDPQLEEALLVRMDFIHFSGFDGAVPDATTICRFRHLLIEQKKMRQVFQAINASFQANGIALKAAETAIVDATIITAAARPSRLIEMEADESEDRTETTVLEMKSERQSADPDARWLKKGKQYYFGYRMHVACDESGFAHAVHVTPANVSEVTQLEEVLGDLRPKRVLTDTGYASKSNREKLKALGIKSGICYKKTAFRPLTHWQQHFNSLVCKSRWVVEPVFGTLKRRFQFIRTRYMGLEKVEAECLFKLMVYNGLKAVRRCMLNFKGRSLA